MTEHPDYAAEARRILKGIPEDITRLAGYDATEPQIIDAITMDVRIATAFALLDVAAAIRNHTNQPTPGSCTSILNWTDLNGPDLCEHPYGHTGAHHSTLNGESTWTDGAPGELRIDQQPTHNNGYKTGDCENTNCTGPLDHPGPCTNQPSTTPPAGACPSVWENRALISDTPGDHLICRYLAGHTGTHRSEDGDARWTDNTPNVHTLGIDR